MRKCIIYVLLLLFSVPYNYSQSVSFNNDAREYSSEERPWVWWFWLGNVVSHELIDQHLNSYYHAGYGGVVVISTYGVKGYEEQEITYRSPKWYEMIQYTIHKAEQLNMKVDIALSSAWPFGGKQVKHDDGAKFMKRMETYSASGNISEKVLADADEYVIAASAFSDDGTYLDLTNKVDKNGTLAASLPMGSWAINVIIGGYTHQMVKRSSPGGEGLVIDHFDKSSLKKYLADFEKDLVSMKGIRSFFNDSYEVYGADYTSSFIHEFEKRRGYSPKPYLNLLFQNEKNDITERFLCDYRMTIADLILENFVTEWVEWSHHNGYKVTEQAHGSPSNLIDMYAASDIPQCESFGPSCFPIKGVRVDEDTRREYFKRPDILHMKFASSAANLMGRPLVSSETATWLTNHFRTALSQVKPEVDKLFVAGINHIHLISSTNTPIDSPYPGWVFYPAPDFGPRSALMEYMPDFSLYVSRIQNVLQHSSPDNEVLLYYPVSDYFSEVKRDLGVLAMMDHIPTKWGNDWPFAVTARKLKHHGYQFDYISDKLLQNVSVHSGVMRTDAGTTYKTLVIPACTRIPVNTMRKIFELANLGVPVVFDSHIPADVPGLYNLSQRLNELHTLKESLKLNPNVSVSDDLDSTLHKLSIHKNSFVAKGLECIRKRMDIGKCFFIANIDSIFTEDVIELDTVYKNIVSYDVLSGELRNLTHRTIDGKTSLSLNLLPGQSLILLADSRVGASRLHKSFSAFEYPISTEWMIKFDANTVSTHDLISWTELSDSTLTYYCGTAEYHTTFDTPVGLKGSSRIQLKMSELRDMAEVVLNGKRVGRIWSVPYVVEFDAKLLKQKNNHLIIRVRNIDTNRIIQMDRLNTPWQECYIADPKRRVYNTKDWKLQPAGIIGKVSLVGNN